MIKTSFTISMCAAFIVIAMNAPLSNAIDNMHERFTIQAYQLSGGGGSNDNDLNTATETKNIWNLLDAGAGPIVIDGGTTYNVATRTSDYETSVNYGGGQGDFFHRIYNVANLHSDSESVINYGGGGGNFGGNIGYGTIGTGAGLGGDQFSVRATADITFNTAGTYRISAASDDGRIVRLDGATLDVNPVGQVNFGAAGGTEFGFTGTTGHANSTGEITVTAGQVVNIDSFFYERGGGDSFEIAVASGSGGACCAGFSLLQNNALGGGEISMGAWDVQAFNLAPGALEFDVDMSNLFETIDIWSHIDGGGTVGATPSFTANGGLGNGYESINDDGPGGSGGPITGGDDFSIRAIADLEFTVGGTYSIALASDDGRIGMLTELHSKAPGFSGITATGGQITGGLTTANIWGFDGTTGHNRSVAVFTVAAGDRLNLDALFFERGGGDSFEISIKAGADTSFGGVIDDWQVLEHGVLGINLTGIPEPTTAMLGLLGVTGLVMRRRRAA